MELRVHNELRKRIAEKRDIALIAAPGMGLSSLLQTLADIDRSSIAWLEVDTLKRFWEIEYEARLRNRRFVIHAATLSALIQAGCLAADVEEQDLFKTNIPAFLQNRGFDRDTPVFIIIDGFDKLPDDLALMVCNEVKRLDDMRGRPGYEQLKSVRFVIGGSISFPRLFAGEMPTGVSPATNFSKIKPFEFLLSHEEASGLLERAFPRYMELHHSLRQLVIDWSGGYLHYVLEFARWVLSQRRQLETLTVQALISKIRTVVEEQDRIPVFRYCYAAWSQVQDSKPLVDTLVVSVSAGSVHDTRGSALELARLGLLLEDPIFRNFFYPANRLIELFVRQRLAEAGKVLSLEDSAVWALPSLNTQAYRLVLDIENQLRNFIGDRLFSQYGVTWIDDCFSHIRAADGRLLLEKIKEREQQEHKSIYAVDGMTDSFLTLLDFPDLSLIVKQESGLYPQSFSASFPLFIEELNYYRRRIAHSRPMALSQINALERRWRVIQRSISSRL